MFHRCGVMKRAGSLFLLGAMIVLSAGHPARAQDAPLPKRQSPALGEQARKSTAFPPLDERLNLIRTSDQEAAFRARRAELKQAAVARSGVGLKPGRVRRPASDSVSTQKADAVTVFTVNVDYDDPDNNKGDGICYDGFGNPFDECTLRAAIQEANATAGSDPIVIRFDIISPARGAASTVAYDADHDLWTILVNNPASVDTYGVLPALTRDNVLIDATTQLEGSGIGTFPDAYCGAPYAGDTSIVKVAVDGSDLTESGQVGLEIHADNVEIRGLAVSNFPGNGIYAVGADNLKIECSYLGVDHLARAAAGNGSSGVAEQDGSGFEFTNSIASANEFAGIYTASTGSRIDSSFFGLDVTGLAPLGNQISGMHVLGSHLRLREVFAGDNGSGLYIGGDSAAVTGSVFGVGTDRSTAVPNAEGITIAADSVRIGGPAGGGNLVSGNLGVGIALIAPAAPAASRLGGLRSLTSAGPQAELNSIASGIFLFGNRIGTAADGATPLANASDGIGANTTLPATIGGSGPAQNVIGHNGGAGIRVDNTGPVRIFENEVFSNTGLGIDLSGDGVTANDAGTPPDTDSGPNGLQNFPVITAALLINPTTVAVAFDFESTPSTRFRFDYYRSTSPDPSGNGEGAAWIKTYSESTDANGDLGLGLGFSVVDLPVGSWVTVTASDSLSGTSEFSNAVQVIGSIVTLSNAKVFLEGPYAGGSMGTDLYTNGHIPLDQPYDDAAFDGTLQEVDTPVSLTSIPANTVDWVVLSLRSTIEAASEAVRRVALLRNDGVLTELDGGTGVLFAGVDSASYRLVVCHRNHLCAMSAEAIDFSSGSGSWDFTTGSTQAYSGGGAPMKALPSGKFGLFSADVNSDGLITALDFTAWLASTTAGETGYRMPDFNMDGLVTALDFTEWIANTTAGAASRVPN